MPVYNNKTVFVIALIYFDSDKSDYWFLYIWFQCVILNNLK